LGGLILLFLDMLSTMICLYAYQNNFQEAIPFSRCLFQAYGLFFGMLVSVSLQLIIMFLLYFSVLRNRTVFIMCIIMFYPRIVAVLNNWYLLFNFWLS
jgi:uncharacterized protein YacL